jgi:hypothetical protein
VSTYNGASFTYEDPRMTYDGTVVVRYETASLAAGSALTATLTAVRPAEADLAASATLGVGVPALTAVTTVELYSASVLGPAPRPLKLAPVPEVVTRLSPPQGPALLLTAPRPLRCVVSDPAAPTLALTGPAA